MGPGARGWGYECPVCGRPTGDVGTGPCPSCGLPAAAHAALVVARIGTTLGELARDRDALLASLRAAAPGAPRTGAPAWGPPVAPPAAPAPVAAFPPPGTFPPPPAPPTAPPAAGPPQAAPAPRPPRRQLSPQQVLLGLGALLLVTAALAFVAVAWTRLGLVFQAGLMLTVTAVACGCSTWAARRGLRATEEALAAAGAALLAIDLGAARARGLPGIEDLPLRLWTAISCGVVLGVALLLGRLTRTTAVWPLAALLAAQPLPFLLLGADLVSGPAGVAAALALAAADLAAAGRLRPGVDRVALVLAAVAGTAGVVGGIGTAAGADAADSWASTAVLAVAGAAALAVDRRNPVLLPGLPSWTVPAAFGAMVGLGLAGSLQHADGQGWWIAASLGLGLLTAGALLAERLRTAAPVVAAGTALVLVHAQSLADDERYGALAAVALAATVPALVTALRVVALRPAAAAATVLASAGALLLARADDVLPAVVAGLLLALLAAAGFGAATARRDRAEEYPVAAAAALAGLAAGATSASVEAWGQVGLQLGVLGVAAGCYAVVAGQRPVAVVAVADLVVATWIAVGGAGVETPEAYTLPAAAGLLVLAVPALRSGAPSWAAEGAAVGVALVPSALVVAAEPTALRLVLVVAGAAGLVVFGTLGHRQAPFVIGTGVLLLVTVARLAPYAPLLPLWVSLGTAALLLLAVGATYERRRQQAREAVAWVGQMR
ncbi:DUF2157 domain-containing protein [Blastococcus sp. TML/M2B]|uniref:DUF2157 domain-containing protein n=1 Tax=unclassified Blastococcus TaxID=2619396 RepID=UPI00190D6A56|nr:MULTISPECIES: DUF2157 domain-containing protein [unclassified Blastococcus]MBN1093090.1 DUF2157 domain-containing protein [Blastococcus sp. TML/M2B]MBN1096789.1 DUF2157 domain-containing protein [Blastococcus sp. TML/C7B]